MYVDLFMLIVSANFIILYSYRHIYKLTVTIGICLYHNTYLKVFSILANHFMNVNKCFLISICLVFVQTQINQVASLTLNMYATIYKGDSVKKYQRSIAIRLSSHLSICLFVHLSTVTNLQPLNVISNLYKIRCTRVYWS